MSNPLTFTLGQLSLTDTLTLGPEFDAAVITAVAGTDAAMDVTVAEFGKHFFKFRTDSLALTDSALETDVEWGRGDDAVWPNKNFASLATLTAANAKGGHNGAKVSEDMTRLIFADVTGGEGGADIFKNEADMVANVESRNIDCNALLNTSTTLASVGQTILGMILNETVRRHEISALIAARGTAVTDYMQLPKFKVGDKIVIGVTYVPKDVTPLAGGNAIQTRQYKITMTVVA